MKSLPHDTTTPLPALPREGEILDGKYRIDGVLGSGGMGVVFAATHLRLAERVAIKMLQPEWLAEPILVERFAREGRASATIRSEHSVRVLDVDDWKGQPYLVLEYLEGSDFETMVAKGGPLSPATAVDYLLQAGEAIAEAHAAGIIHRDLKPANLFLTHRADRSACVKVLDFGISKVSAKAERVSGVQKQDTLPLTVMGSPHYMSPEQMRSAADVDERSDVWSMGAILHELLSGAPPWDDESITALCAHVLTDPAPPLSALRSDLPPSLERVVLRCLEKRPEDRFRTVAELARALVPFGSSAGRESAARISRVLEGGIDIRPSKAEVDDRPTLPHATMSSAAGWSAADEVALTPSMRRPVGGYVLATLAALAIVGGIAWKVGMQAHAVHVAQQEPPAQAALGVATSVAATSPIPPPPPIASAEVATTGAVVAAPLPAPRAPSTASDPIVPAPPVAPEAPQAAATHRRHHSTHRAGPTPAPSPEPESTIDLSSLRRTAVEAPAAAATQPTPAPQAAPPATIAAPDTNALFDERK